MASTKINQDGVRKVGRTTSVSEDVCVVCFKDIIIRSIMDCEHTICYECSTRLRVLCNKLECPICRQETTIAVFTREKNKFRPEYLRALHNEDRYKLALEDESVRREFAALLANTCPICKEKKRSFGTLKQLSDHVHKEHQLQYCDLCTEHLKIFSHERKTYTREKLALHRRKGDPDDSSHRGHPLCEFCEKRYFDKDALFIHLRRDHFYCHLCEADGHQYFYDDYESLAEHFKSEHFLCEQGECGEKKFVVFRTNIDLQAHDLLEHADKKSRGQQRHDRTLTLEFGARSDRRRPQAEFGANGGDGGSHRRRDDRRGNRGQRGEANRREPESPPRPSSPVMTVRRVDTSSTQEFPTLAGEAAAAADGNAKKGNLAQRVATASGKTVRNTASKGRPWDNRAVPVTEDEFPTLGGAAVAPAVHPAPTRPRQEAEASASRRGGGKSGRPRPARAGAPVSEDDFPSLGGPAAVGPAPQHNSAAMFEAAARRSETSKAAKHQPVRQQTRNTAVEDFPTLAPPAPRAAPVPVPTVAPQRRAPVRTAVTSSTPAAAASGGQKKGGRGGGGGAGKTVGKSATSSAQAGFKKRQGSAAAMALAQASYNASDFYSSDEEPPPEYRPPPATHASKITVVPRAADPPRLPPAPPPSQDDFPSLGGTAQPVSWVKPKPKKAEPAHKPKPKPQPKSAEQEYPSLGPVAAHGNFREFVGVEDSSTSAGKASWATGDSVLNNVTNNNNSAKSSKNKKNKNKKQAGKVEPAAAAVSETSQNGISSERRSPVDLSYGRERSAAAKAVPPGLPRPPPGFGRSPSPPEQWEDAEDSPLSNVPDISPSTGEELVYIQPRDFSSRNEKLLRTARQLFQGDDFSTFQAISKMFLEGSMVAEDYYSTCLDRLGNSKFGRLFPELLVLMPNIQRQQELLAAHEKLNRNGFTRNKFPSCPTCGQVLVFDDMASHSQLHADNDDFPTFS